MTEPSSFHINTDFVTSLTAFGEPKKSKDKACDIFFKVEGEKIAFENKPGFLQRISIRKNENYRIENIAAKLQGLVGIEEKANAKAYSELTLQQKVQLVALARSLHSTFDKFEHPGLLRRVFSRKIPDDKMAIIKQANAQVKNLLHLSEDTIVEDCLSDLTKNIDKKSAISILEKEASQGNTKAMQVLGALYMKGEYVALNFNKAEQLLSKAAKAGNMRAKVDLAQLVRSRYLKAEHLRSKPSSTSHRSALIEGSAAIDRENKARRKIYDRLFDMFKDYPQVKNELTNLKDYLCGDFGKLDPAFATAILQAHPATRKLQNLLNEEVQDPYLICRCLNLILRTTGQQDMTLECYKSIEKKIEAQSKGRDISTKIMLESMKDLISPEEKP